MTKILTLGGGTGGCVRNLGTGENTGGGGVKLGRAGHWWRGKKPGRRGEA